MKLHLQKMKVNALISSQEKKGNYFKDFFKITLIIQGWMITVITFSSNIK